MNTQTTNQQPKLKKGQDKIIHALFQYRFLHSKQLQIFLKHKSPSRINDWLKELTERKYITQYYDKTFASLPAVYSLGIKSRKYIKNNPDFKNINPVLLDRIWKVHTLSPQFRERCQLVANIYLSLVALSTKTKAKLNFSTQTDLYGMEYMILDNPDAYFSIVEKDKTVSRYFLDIFDDVAYSKLHLRIRQYFYYYDKEYWQDNTGKPFPNIMLVCPSERIKYHLFYYIQGKLDRAPDLNFYLTTRDQIIAKGINRDVLKKVELPD
ncbi:MAG TPA: hypothetical protein ACFYEK_07000 [Candidatus Wunengus sp. YC60]|uniref:hypothetical protein n=1 Tax=Candidatus Wunengus sp. YC60 TaxID=3367697 RepID=UPI0040253F09